MDSAGYTETQTVVLRILLFIFPLFSILASSLIIYIGRSKLDDPYHRLLVAMSALDAVVSLNYCLGGKYLTCNLSGMLLQLSICGALYNLSLCIYYVLSIKYQWTNDRFRATRIELVMHSISIMYPLLFGVLALSADLYRPGRIVPQWCSLGPNPDDCDIQGSPQCQRNKERSIYVAFGTVLPLFLAGMGILASMVIIYQTVRKVEAQQARYGFGPTTPTSPRNQSYFVERVLRNNWIFRRQPPHNQNGNSQSESFARTRQAGIQAFLYTGAFVLTFFGFFFTFIATSVAEPSVNFRFAQGVILVLLMPLQGVWNFVVYIRPRYRRLQKRFPDCHTWKILQCCILDQEPSPKKHSEPNKQEPMTSSREDDDGDAGEGEQEAWPN